MKKVLKNILKWLVCVFLTFTAVFTISQSYEIAEGLYYNYNIIEFEELKVTNEVEERIISQEEFAENYFNSEIKNEEIKQLYNKYPIGTAMVTMSFVSDYVTVVRYGQLAISSIIFGLVIGTVIYLLTDKEKKGLKTIIITYLLVVLISGFAYGFLDSQGDRLNFFWDYCYLPDEYILLATISFVLIIAVRYIKQKNIANKLNEKLNKNKEEKNK